MTLSQFMGLVEDECSSRGLLAEFLEPQLLSYKRPLLFVGILRMISRDDAVGIAVRVDKCRDEESAGQKCNAIQGLNP